MKRHYFIVLAFACSAITPLMGQIDTLNTRVLKLNTAALKQGKSSYAVFFEDSLGGRIGSADIWDRSIRLTKDAKGKSQYVFDWKWYQKDSLMAHIIATGEVPSMKPLTHFAWYKTRGKITFAFKDNKVYLPDSVWRTPRDSTFKVMLDQPAFEFPMDLEIFGLVPFKKVGQQFAISFYEPGSPKAGYYALTVAGKEDLPLPGSERVTCWVLRLDYGKGSVATFWVADKAREVVKMRQYSRGRYRYKVKLY